MHLTVNLGNRLRTLLHKERAIDTITRTRIRILLVSILSLTGLSGSLLIHYLLREYDLLLLINFLTTTVLLTALGLLLFRKPWAAAAHCLIICITLMVWSNILFFQNGVNIVTMQYCLIVISVGYYILGLRQGLFYCLVNVLPVIAAIIGGSYLHYHFPARVITINNNVFALTVIFNFLLLTYIHYSFFHALKTAHAKEQQLRLDLQLALTEAQKMAIAKNNFLVTISHEMRTPLNGITGMANILIAENHLPGQADHLNILQSCAGELTATVNNILEFSRIDSRKLRLTGEGFLPVMVLNDVREVFASPAAAKGLQFESMADPAIEDLAVVGDPVRLAQILYHLVGNAVKFTSNGFVRLTVRPTAADADAVTLLFQVADSGIGIPTDKQQSIFDPFSTILSDNRRQFQGTLGLTIAYQLVALHGSRLRIQSMEGQGTQFEFELKYPLYRGRQTELALAGTKKTLLQLDWLRVLVAEDDKMNVLVMEKVLEKWGIVPHIATNGEEALSMAAAQQYDVILMDINMPVMDGLEAAKKIRALPGGVHRMVPIIAVTASIAEAVEQTGLHRLVDDYLLKPFNPEDLRRKLEQIAADIAL